ncbi:MAG: hypothetical protein QNJ62_05085 [Methyloceanibacter sp.]|nr:hypothetical protein [Methyloceanibacter sp.]
MPAGQADWQRIKNLYCKEGLSPHRIAEHPGIKGTISRQAILKRARREKWQEPSELVTADGSSEVADVTSEPFDGTTLPDGLLDELPNAYQATEARLLRLLSAYKAGAGHTVAAAFAGIGLNTSKAWREASPTLARVIDEIDASRATESIQAIHKAQQRGDWKAAERLLETNRLTKEDGWSQVKQQGGSSFVVHISIPRDSEAVTIEGEVIDQ